MQDVYGNKFKEGHWVIYAVTQGRTSRMRFGIIMRVIGGDTERLSVKGVSYYGDTWSHVTCGTISWSQCKCIVVSNATRLPAGALRELSD